jgi:hypothetical protein
MTALKRKTAQEENLGKLWYLKKLMGEHGTCKTDLVWQRLAVEVEAASLGSGAGL